MSNEDIWTWFLIGCALGFVLGYIVRCVIDIRREVKKAVALLKESYNQGDDDVRYDVDE